MDSFLKFVVFLIILFAVILLLAAPFMWLWNWIAPIYWASAPVLTFWQSFGTLLLLQFLMPHNYINKD